MRNDGIDSDLYVEFMLSVQSYTSCKSLQLAFPFIKKKIYSLNINQAFSGKDYKDLEVVESTIRKAAGFMQRYRFSAYRGQSSTQVIKAKDISKAARLHNTVINWFNETVNGAPLNLLIGVILISGLIGTALEKLISIEAIDITKRSALANKIVMLLKQIRISPAQGGHFYLFHKLYRQYLESRRNMSRSSYSVNDLESIYSFLDAAERDGWLYDNFLLSRITRLLFFLDKEQFLEVINKKTSNFEISVYLKSLDIEDMLSLCKDCPKYNKNVLFEILRQSLLKSSKLNDEQIYLLSLSLRKIFIDDGIFSIFLLQYFKNNYQFYKIIALSLPHVQPDFTDLFVESIEMTQYDFNINKNNELFNHLKSRIPRCFFDDLSCRIFKRYEKLLSEILNKGEYLSGIVITDWHPFILHYYKCQHIDSRKELKLLIANIKSIRTNWFSDFISLRAHFFILLTNIYIHAECLSKSQNKIRDRSFIADFKSFSDDRRTWMYFFDTIDRPSIFVRISHCLQQALNRPKWRAVHGWKTVKGWKNNHRR